MPEPPRPPRRSVRDTLLAGFALALLGARTLVRRLREPPPGRKRPLFPRWSNPAFVGLLAGGAVAGVAVLAFLLVRADSARTGAFEAPPQPVPFSHRIHAGALEVDCRYCHASVERAAPAGMPSTRTCIPCHSEVWLESEPFRPVRESLALGLPIPWRRVNDVPDFAYFHHGIHVENGIGCETCHGRVDRMDRVRQTAPLTMEWCLDCHRRPERYLRPRSEVTTMGWVPRRPQEEVGAELKVAYEVTEMTHCTVCHR